MVIFHSYVDLPEGTVRDGPVTSGSSGSLWVITGAIRYRKAGW